MGSVTVNSSEALLGIPLGTTENFNFIQSFIYEFSQEQLKYSSRTVLKDFFQKFFQEVLHEFV